MAEEFEAAVEDGLRLSKRIYLGKDRAVAPPKPPTTMERIASQSYLPTSPMVYAVINDPAIVDNPDIPSYQPHVHGRCNPPALIPLQMNAISLEVDCYLDTAFVTVTGTWRVHCVMGSRSCDCRIAVPMGEQGSILGVEVQVPRKSYSTQLIGIADDTVTKNTAKVENGSFLKPHIFTLTIPKIDGGTNLLVKLRWSQKLLYHAKEFTLDIPFNFPSYVTPAVRKISKREKIQLNVNSGPGTEVLCKKTSHPLKERLRQAGKLGFIYDSEVLSWSDSDFMFGYAITSDNTFGSVLLSSPSSEDADDREMFCCYLFPGKQHREQVFRKEVVFAIDISGSMRGKLLDDTKNALVAAIGKLEPGDMFNVIAFNGETFPFSSSLEPANQEVIANVTEWINLNFVAGGGTNFLLPLRQAMEMFTGSEKSIPIILFITDGSCEDERHVCDTIKSQLANHKNIRPRIYTLGIGTFCNTYFLRMLSIIGRGHHKTANDVDSVEVQMAGLFARASSICLADIVFMNLDNLDDLEVFPSRIPDLSSESPLIVSGRYCGTFPEALKVEGILPNKTKFSLDLKVQEAKEIPIGKIVAKEQIEALTSQSWYSENKELEHKIAKMSVQNSIVSEYTNMTLFESERGKTYADSVNIQKVAKKVENQKGEDYDSQTRMELQPLGHGFGDISATVENIRPGFVDKQSEVAEIFVKAASTCFGKLCNNCCCMCCIQTCSKMNDQCAIVLTQLCGALSCLGCYACCGLCCGGDE